MTTLSIQLSPGNLGIVINVAYTAKTYNAFLARRGAGFIAY